MMLLSVGLLVLVACACLYNFAYPIRRERRKAYRYRLFKVRDELILLVATGALKEDDPLFQALYRSVNFLIPRAQPLTLPIFMRAFREIPAVEDDAADALIEDLMSRDDEVRKVGANFFHTVGSILFDVSLTVRIAVPLMVRIALVKQFLESSSLGDSILKERSQAALACLEMNRSARALGF